MNCSKFTDVSSLNHSRWEFKYHVVVWFPKYPKKALNGQLRKYLCQVFKDLAHNRECEVLELHMISDHVHMLMSIPSKYAEAQVVGFLKGKSAIHVARNYLGKKRNFTGAHFWARGYHVSKVGQDEQMIRNYLKAQEEEDRRIDQLNFSKQQRAATFEVVLKQSL